MGSEPTACRGGHTRRDDRDELAGIPVRREQVEVEGLVVLVRAEIQRPPRCIDPGLGDHHPVVVLVEQSSPPTHDRVDAVAVDERMLPGRHRRQLLDRTGVGIAGRLHETVGDVDAETRGTTIEPEPHHCVEFVRDRRMIPVQVRLALVVDVEIPLAVGDAGPCRPAEHRLPVVGRQLLRGRRVRRRSGSGHARPIPAPRRVRPGTRRGPTSCGWARGRRTHGCRVSSPRR